MLLRRAHDRTTRSSCWIFHRRRTVCDLFDLWRVSYGWGNDSFSNRLTSYDQWKLYITQRNGCFSACWCLGIYEWNANISNWRNRIINLQRLGTLAPNRCAVFIFKIVICQEKKNLFCANAIKMQKPLAKSLGLWYNHIVSFNVALQAIIVTALTKCLKCILQALFCFCFW